MSRDAYWTNADGLVVGFGTREVEKNSAGKVATSGAVEELVLRINDATALADTVAATDDAIVHGAEIPADSLILSADLFVTTAFAGATATLDIGVYQRDGTIVDDDGIDAAIAVATLADNAVVSCDGADVGTVTATAVKIACSYDTAAFTAGAATLVIRYIPKGQ